MLFASIKSGLDLRPKKKRLSTVSGTMSSVSSPLPSFTVMAYTPGFSTHWDNLGITSLFSHTHLSTMSQNPRLPPRHPRHPRQSRHPRGYDDCLDIGRHLVASKSMELQSVYNHRCLRPIGRFDGYPKSDVSASCNIYDISCFVVEHFNIQLEPIAETVLELGASCSKMQLGNYTCAGTWIFLCEVGFAIDATWIYLCGHMDISVRS